MTSRKSLLACCVVLGLFGCESADMDSKYCSGAKCDDPNQIGAGELMPRAPSTPGSLGVTRNQDSWTFELIGAKGEIVLLSENYAQRTAALGGMLSLEENGVLAERYTLKQTNGGWAIELRAANNELLADSQLFASEAEAAAAIESTRELIAGVVQYKSALAGGAGFELARDAADWEFVLRDEDGQAIMQSQVYSRRTDAITGIESVRSNGKEITRYSIVDGPTRFVLKAGNGEEIAESSETFASHEAAQAAIEQTQTLLRSERVANPW